MEDMNINELLGETLKSIQVNSDQDRITFETHDGKEYVMYHSQDCCESVSIDDIIGDLNDLIGYPITMAEEVSNGGRGENDYDADYNVKGVRLPDWPEGIKKPDYAPESYTWTFYKLATIKGSVTIRWYGTSNGYYSESVTFGRAA